jgi:ATP-dependent DNA ligase
MRSRIELARVGPLSTGLSVHKRLQPLAIKKMPLAAPPPRDNRFGRPLELAKVHWIRPELVAEITYLSWPEDGLLLSLKVRRALIGAPHSRSYVTSWTTSRPSNGFLAGVDV